MEEFARQLRTLRDGGLDYTLDDLIEAIGRPGPRRDIGKDLDFQFDVIENLQTIARSRARKAA